MNSSSLAAYLLTLDEEHHVAAAVASLRQVAENVLVVDSGSRDRTCELAAAAGGKVVHHAFESFSAQRNWALDEIQRTYGPSWVLTIDADERLTPSLASEIREVLDTAPN